MTTQAIRSILGYRDEHELGCEVDSGRAGIIHHDAGIGHVRICLEEGDEIYVKGQDLADFARLYRSLGREAIASVVVRKINPTLAQSMGLMDGSDYGH